MGREIRRVPLDFNWPLNKVWEGFLNPYYQFRSTCGACDGSGYNPDTKSLSDTWYDHDGDRSRAWCNAITQDEVDALIAAGQLHDFCKDFVPGEGWIDKNPPVNVTADQVNEASKKHGPFVHDCVNRHICVETRAKRLGVYGECSACLGEGELWSSPDAKKKYDEWEQTPPPAGDGWQLWETVSEGSPITPVFATSDELVAHMVKPSPPDTRRPFDTPHAWGQGYSREAAEAMIKHAWAPSGIMIGGRMMNGPQGLAEMDAGE